MMIECDVNEGGCSAIAVEPTCESSQVFQQLFQRACLTETAFIEPRM